MKFSKPNKNKFPVINFLKLIPNNNSLFETVLVAANDELVELFLEGKIKYPLIHKYLVKITNMIEFKKYFKKTPKDLNQISNLIDQVRLKIRQLCIKWLLILWKNYT